MMGKISEREPVAHEISTKGISKTMQSVEIRVKGQIDQGWSEWVGGLTISYTVQGDTVLTGQVRDQAALYGLLEKLSNVGMQLLSFTSQGIIATTAKEGRKM
jgi:hypothetical protein